MHLLFVCAGNTCRSPLAEVVAVRAGVEAASAGLQATPGEPASARAIAVAKAAGLDLTAHRSRLLSAADLSEADAVYAMTAAQADAIRAAWPEGAARVERLDAAADIADPFRSSDATYRQVLDRIEHAIAARLRAG